MIVYASIGNIVVLCNYLGDHNEKNMYSYHDTVIIYKNVREAFVF